MLCGCTLLPAFLHAQTERPNIVIVLVGDLGWGDVGFHGSEIKTPCLDALVGEGVELERFYTSPISTPTRAGLMTGRYPNRFGVRSAVIPPWREDGLDENEETILICWHVTDIRTEPLLVSGIWGIPRKCTIR